MKKLRRFLPLLLIPMIAACGGGADADAEGEAGENESEAVALFADVVELTGKSSLNPAEFNRLVNFMNDQEVTLVGHPYAYPLGEGAEVEFKPNSTTMIDGMDNTTKNIEVSIKFKGSPEVRKMHIGDVFAVKGKLEVDHSVSSYGASTRIYITDAEFVDGATAKLGDAKSIIDLDPSKPIFCGDLYSLMNAHYLGLAKKKITVSGPYVSTTVSKSLDGAILEIRVDLGDSDNKVGCEMVEEPDGDALNAKRSAKKDLVIEGTFAGIVFGNPRISGGVLK